MIIGIIILLVIVGVMFWSWRLGIKSGHEDFWGKHKCESYKELNDLHENAQNNF